MIEGVYMRRTDRELTDDLEKIGIIGKSKVCRLGLSENGVPYIVPLNFGYEYAGGVLSLYFHSAPAGKKIGILKQKGTVCFEVDGGHEIIEGVDVACRYGYAYESVIGFGEVEFITDKAEKIRALNVLMQHQTGKDMEFAYEDPQLEGVAVFKLAVSSFTGKRRTMPV
jgi:nitroimidazol reductase NimA-like FMN-containing flavoprotein (pyridoxamine 5'-phosphate oxidase superfamily)